MGIFSLDFYMKTSITYSISLKINKRYGRNLMKKLIIATISVFVLVNFAFAQSAKQKVDSLKREKAKAEQAKELADDRLRNDMTEPNYQAAKAAKEQMEKVNKELEFALETLKAEEEAKAKAKAEAELKAKEEEQKKLEALYKKRFSSFDFAGVGGLVKQYILEELKNNPNWDIEDLFLTEDIKSGYRIEYNLHIISSSGEKVIPVADIRLRNGNDIDDDEEKCMNAIAQAWEWHKNPEEFYLFKCDSKMQKAVINYYKKYTGRNYDIKDAIINKKCKSVEFYYIDMPKDNNSNFNLIFNQNNNSAFMARQNEINYIYAVCDSDSKENIIIRPNHSYFDKIYAEKHPRRTIKTFKIEDYK